jgi:hypothetical protein
MIKEIREYLKKPHPRTCGVWVFSGPRLCSCGRDKALRALEILEAREARLQAWRLLPAPVSKGVQI